MPADGCPQPARHSRLPRLYSAVFYAGSSFVITVVNKTVLTSFRFPSYLCLGIGQIFPLPLLYVGNHITGLASTKKLRKTFPKRLVYSVVAIVLGAMVAASSDLAFDVEAYSFILLNDVFTAASGVYTKKKLGTEGLGKYGLLFYNALLLVVPTLLASAYTGDLHKALAFEDWVEGPFVFCFLTSCFMGFVLMYSIVLCSYYNSALTTTVVGAIKNVAVAYIGIFVGGDYLFSWTNFLGLSICMSGGLMYSYLAFKQTSDGSDAEGGQELKIRIAEDPTGKPSAH
ncbi:UDP-N-acetylglucosamine/UDP-glucose/GDP-mannose transporter [Liparis tanakae]|uniref:UDP-N-acetylglucosamine/UDP-glucose/GDP-mannose transporter n=1 Tax=Liparis tanakae TaxID=230148 RepID=A0A4Z2GC33_9TELE|nr:UDP-N-acetylglucosamine/UDP-glucose/GDP-mannose transporter [Liparis tanakae]